MASRRTPSVPLLVVVLLVACLGPVFISRVVGTSDDDDLSLTGAAARRAAQAGGDVSGEGSGASGDGASGGSSGEGAGGSDPGAAAEATTTTTAAPTTTTAPPPPPTTAPPTTAAPAPTTTEAPPPPPPTAPPAPTGLADEVVGLVNIARSQAGCGPLTVDDRLRAAAQAHSDDMSARSYMDHVTPEGQDPSARAAAQGYTGAGIGENIAQGYPDPVAVMQGWLDSPGHKANIENCSYTVIGVGVAEGGWYWTQVFGM